MFKTVSRSLSIMVLCLLATVMACTGASVEPTATPVSAATPLATPQAAKTNVSIETATTPAAEAGGDEQPAEKDESSSFLITFNNSIQSLWEILVGLVITFLVLYLVYRTITESLRYRIEFDQLQNGTGDQAIKDSLEGMESLVREKLIYQISALKETIDRFSGRTSEGATFPSKLPLPEDAQSGEALNKVVDALGAESPKYIKPLLYLYRYLFPQQGMRVKMTLQHDGNSPGQIGITFEFFDLSNQQRSKVYTLWEEAAVEVKIQPWFLCKTASSTGTASKKGETDQATQAPQEDSRPWPLLVAQALERASLYQDAITYYEKALAEDKLDHEATEGLVACQNRLGRRVGPASAFATASRLEKSGLLEAAVESYARIFAEKQDIDFAREHWAIAIGLKDGSKGQAFCQLADAYFKKLDLYDEAVGLYKLAVQEGHPQAIETLKRIQTTQADELVAASQWLFANEQWEAADTYLMQAVASVPEHAGAVLMQTKLKENKPPQEDREALAAFELGKLYQAQGIMSVAKEQLEKAVEKQPDYKEAKEVLTEVLEQTRTLRSRFEGFLDNALFWLAIELFRMETNRMKNEEAVRECRKAQYHNFYGAYLLAYYEACPTFMELAEKEFREAINACPDWLQPFENLGDMYSLQVMNQEESDLAHRTLEKAIACYDVALQKKSLDPSGKLTDITTPVALRVRLDRHVTDLLRCPVNPDPLWKDIQDAEAEIRLKHPKLEDITVKEEYEEVYFSLALWYALIAYRYEKTDDPCGCPEPKQAKAWACFYLTCAVILEPDRMYEAEMNPIMLETITEEQRENLVNLIEIIQFQQEALKVKKEFNWKDVRDTLVHAGVDLPDKLEKE